MIFTPLHKSAINNSLKQGLSFALFRDKGSDDLTFVCDDNSARPPLSNKEFFAVNWLGKFSDRISIVDRLTAKQAAEYKSDASYRMIEPWTRSTEKYEYLPSVQMLIDELKAQGSKTVISRVIAQPFSGNIADIAERYFEINTNTYCCLLHTPKCGCWLIASPELLLSANLSTQTVETVALAGTRKRDTLSEGQKGWDAKNIAEQQFVSDFITQIFRDLSLEIKVSNKETIQVNNVEHISTQITGKIKSNADIEQVIDRLSPTPALCGTPRDRAIKNIRSIEHHQRRLYGGYFGYVDDKQFKAVVTLRCAQLSHNNSCIYAGGGITADSDAQEEWEETTLKSQSLSKILMYKNNE
jgi:isochorismate synthase